MSRGRVAAVTAALVVVVAAGCSSTVPGSATAPGTPAPPAAGSAGSRAPGTPGAGTTVGPQGFGLVTVRVRQPDGSTREYCLWLADTEAAREKGLMGVSDPGLGGRPGMLFAYDDETVGSYWMKDTLLPLSIAYVAADGHIVSSTDMEPCPAGERNCPTYPSGGAFRYAVEVPKGRLGDIGLTGQATLEVVTTGCSSG